MEENRSRRTDVDARVRQLSGLLDSAQDVVLLVRLDGEILYENRVAAEARRWFTWPHAGNTVGKLLSDIGLSEKTLELFEDNRSRVAAGETVAVEILNPTESGLRWSEIKLSPLYDDRGKVEAITIIARDIDERKLALATAQRIQAELTEAVHANQQMMAVLGHDLRNPLSAIQTAAIVMARDESLSKKAAHLTSIIHDASTRMQEMTDTLLDFAHTRFVGPLPITRKKTNIHETCQRALAELRVVHPDRDIVLQCEGDTIGMWDSARISQLIVNLVANALTHGVASAPVHVRIVGEEHVVMIEVNNSGPPIPPDVLPNVFDPFRRGDATTRSKTQKGLGLGLGLYIVQQIALAHGGTVNVTSTAARGTTFRVNLPRAGQECH